MISVHNVQWIDSQNNINAWFNFIKNTDTWHKPHFMIGRQSGEHRSNNGRYPASVCRRCVDKMSSTDRPAIVGWLTADYQATFGRYHGVNFFKTSTDCRSPMTKPLKFSGSVNETFNLGASTKKSSADQKIRRNRCRCRPTIGRRRPFFKNFAHRPSADRRFG